MYFFFKFSFLSGNKIASTWHHEFKFSFLSGNKIASAWHHEFKFSFLSGNKIASTWHHEFKFSFLSGNKIASTWHHEFNPLNAELNPICCLLTLLRAHYFLHVSRIRVKFSFLSGNKIASTWHHDFKSLLRTLLLLAIISQTSRFVRKIYFSTDFFLFSLKDFIF